MHVAFRLVRFLPELPVCSVHATLFYRTHQGQPQEQPPPCSWPHVLQLSLFIPASMSLRNGSRLTPFSFSILGVICGLSAHATHTRAHAHTDTHASFPSSSPSVTLSFIPGLHYCTHVNATHRLSMLYSSDFPVDGRICFPWKHFCSCTYFTCNIFSFAHISMFLLIQFQILL